MKQTQRKAHLFIWSAWIVWVPLVLFFALKDRMQSAPLIPPLIESALEQRSPLNYEIMGMGDERVLDLYVTESFSYPAVVVRAITEADSKGIMLGQVAGPGMYRFELPPGAREVWLFDTVQGKTVYQIPL